MKNLELLFVGNMELILFAFVSLQNRSPVDSPHFLYRIYFLTSFSSIGQVIMYKARKIAFYDPQGKAELLGKMFFYYVRYVTHFFSQKRDTQQLA